MTRLIDRLLIKRDTGYWEGLASGAAVLTSTYGSPDREAILPQVAGWAQQANAADAVVFAAIMARMHLLSEARFQFQRQERPGPVRRHVAAHPGASVAGRNVPAASCWPGWSRTCRWPGTPTRGRCRASDLLVRLRPDWVTIVSRARARAGRRPVPGEDRLLVGTAEDGARPGQRRVLPGRGSRPLGAHPGPAGQFPGHVVADARLPGHQRRLGARPVQDQVPGKLRVARTC